MKNIICTCILIASVSLLYAQSTIDKQTYIQKYRVRGAFLTKPLPERSAKAFASPIVINGYLCVYPMDLGYFNTHPNDIIVQINKQKKFGKDNWRIPTPDELAIMEANADKIGLGNDIYLATDHRNGVLRLVSVEGEYYNCVKVGNTYWMKTNLGAQYVGDGGSVVSYDDAVRFCPSGFRLPTKEEYEELLASGSVYFENVIGSPNADLYFPVRQVATFYMNEKYRVRGDYFIAGDQYYLTFQCYNDAGYVTKDKPEIVSGSAYEGFARYVLDR